MPSPPGTVSKPKIGISACLLGAQVRYDGGHKESRLCSHLLREYFEFIPVCPEMAIGLGVPREPIRLVGTRQQPQALGVVHPDQNVTQPLADYGARMAIELNDVCGYIFMQKSPSCGLEKVKVYQDDGRLTDHGGRGIYAQAFCARHPNLPVEEDGRLSDPVLRENFLTRVFVYFAWQQLQHRELTRYALTEFHARHKYLLMAHNPVQYKILGNLLGSLGKSDPGQIAPIYFSQLMAALKTCATRQTHTNVLQHLSGYLKRSISPEDKQEIQRTLHQYLSGVVPLVVPITLLKHHLRLHPNPYLAQQVYLQPHPEDLSLRNSI